MLGSLGLFTFSLEKGKGKASEGGRGARGQGTGPATLAGLAVQRQQHKKEVPSLNVPASPKGKNSSDSVLGFVYIFFFPFVGGGWFTFSLLLSSSFFARVVPEALLLGPGPAYFGGAELGS